MIIKTLWLLILMIILLSCSTKEQKVDLKNIKPTNPLYRLGVDLAKKLDIKLRTNDIDHSKTLDEITLILSKNELRVIINGHIFQRGKAKPVQSTRYIIEDLASVINNYPKLEIRVYGHSENLATLKKRQDLSDN